MNLWTKELGCIDLRRVDEHEDELIDNERLDNYVYEEEPIVVPNGDYMTRSVVENKMKNNINTTIKVASTSVVTEMVQETIESAFTVDFDEQKEVIKIPIRNMVKELRLASSNRIA